MFKGTNRDPGKKRNWNRKERNWKQSPHPTLTVVRQNFITLPLSYMIANARTGCAEHEHIVEIRQGTLFIFSLILRPQTRASLHSPTCSLILPSYTDPFTPHLPSLSISAHLFCPGNAPIELPAEEAKQDCGTVERSLTYMLNSSRPRILPCGTPDVTSRGLEIAELMRTTWNLSER